MIQGIYRDLVLGKIDGPLLHVAVLTAADRWSGSQGGLRDGVR